MILLLRHGETFWNRERRIQGRAESPLTSSPIWSLERVSRSVSSRARSAGVWGRCLRGMYAGLSTEQTNRQPVPQDAVFRLHDGRIDRFDCPPLD